jgi:hypothetical protein
LAGEFVDTRHVTQRAADEVPGRETGLQSPVSEPFRTGKTFGIRATGVKQHAMFAAVACELQDRQHQ